MKCIINENELVGKTISKIRLNEFNGNLGIVFSDDSYCIIIAAIHDDEPELELIKLDENNKYDIDELYKLGVIAAEHHKSILLQEEKKKQKDIDTRELIEYNRLKNKFEKALGSA